MLQIPSAPVQLPASPEKRQQSQFNMIGIECCFEKFSGFVCNCHMYIIELVDSISSTPYIYTPHSLDQTPHRLSLYGVY